MVINIEIKFLESEKNIRPTFTYSMNGILYNFSLFVCLSVLNFFSVRYIGKLDFPAFFENIFQKSQTVFTLIVCFIILITYCFKQKKFIEIANKLQIVTDSLMDIDIGKSEKISFLNKIKLIYLVNCVIWLILLITSYIGAYPMIYIFLHLSNFTINWMIMQYSSILLLVYHLFKIINSNLKNIFLSPTALSNIEILQQNNYRDNYVSPQKLRKLLFIHQRESYLSLCAISNEISDFYSVSILFCIIYIFITSLLYLYFNGDLLLYNVSAGIPILIYINCLLWVVFYIFALVVISKAASRAVAEVK